MKYILLFAAMWLFVHTHGEDRKSTVGTGRRIVIFYSPDYTKGVFNGRYGYAAGFVFSADRSTRSGFDMGLQFSSRGDYIKNLFFSSNIYLPGGGVDTSFAYTYKYQFLEIPFRYRFRIKSGSAPGFYLSGGLSPNIYIRTRTRKDAYPSSGGMTEGKEYTNGNVDFSPVVLSAMAGFGLEFRLGDHINMVLHPEFRYYFTSLMGESPIASNIYAVGMGLGVAYAF